MESIKTGYSFAIAENQEEYNTVHGTVHDVQIQTNPVPVNVKAITIKYKFNPDEIAELLMNDGEFYYTQVVGQAPLRPHSINVFNPLPEELR